MLGSFYTRFKSSDPDFDGLSARADSGFAPDPGLEAYGLWDKIVTTYTRDGLTREEDKLIALSGIAKETQQMLSDDCVAGYGRISCLLNFYGVFETASKPMICLQPDLIGIAHRPGRGRPSMEKRKSIKHNQGYLNDNPRCAGYTPHERRDRPSY